MEEQIQKRSSVEEQRVVDYDSDKSSNFNSVISDNLEKDHESQISEKELSTFRLVLLLAALWVCQSHLPLCFHCQDVANQSLVWSLTLSTGYGPTILCFSERA